MQPRYKRDEEFTDAENLKELCDIQASKILSQGLPRRIFNTINKTQSAKEIWESLELLMKGSGQTLDRRKEDLFDEYEHFRDNGNELIQDYFVRFHKLINDMNVTKLTIPTHQMNTKFINNLPPYWSKYVTSVKNVKNLSTDSYIDLYIYLRSYEEHALKKLKKAGAVLQCNTGNTGYRGNQNNGQGVNNKKKVICYNCREEEHVARHCKEPKRPKDSLWHQDKVMLLQAKENGAVLDVEAEAFLADVECTVPLAEPLALTTTNMFQDEHLDSDDDSVHEDYTIPYDQYLATKESQDVPTEASPIPPTAAYMLQTLTNLTTQVEGHRKVNQEQALINATLSAELDQCKLKFARLERNTVKLECDQVILARNKRNAKLEQETELLKTTLRNKEATIASLTSETKTVLSEKKTLEDK
nr:integrase, catalytic region, zinc finger, CCHC-type, peptidase aspartic, catalytic [Tanacetum cinerariifolium]